MDDGLYYLLDRIASALEAIAERLIWSYEDEEEDEEASD